MPCQPHEVWCSHPHFNSSRYWFTYDFGAHYVVEVVAVLSIIGSLLICTSFAVWPDLRRATSRHILVFLSVADLGASLTNAVGALDFVGEGDSCKAQAFSFVYWSLSFVLWSSCMAIYLYVSIVQDNVLKARGLLIPFHVVCWGLPLIMAVSALAAGALGQSSSGSTLGWCWVAVQPKHPSGIKCGSSLVLWMALTLKMWELLSYVVIPFLYFSVKCHIRKEVSACFWKNVLPAHSLTAHHCFKKRGGGGYCLCTTQNKLSSLQPGQDSKFRVFVDYDARSGGDVFIAERLLYSGTEAILLPGYAGHVTIEKSCTGLKVQKSQTHRNFLHATTTMGMQHLHMSTWSADHWFRCSRGPSCFISHKISKSDSSDLASKMLLGANKSCTSQHAVAEGGYASEVVYKKTRNSTPQEKALHFFFWIGHCMLAVWALETWLRNFAFFETRAYCTTIEGAGKSGLGAYCISVINSPGELFFSNTTFWEGSFSQAHMFYFLSSP